MLFHSAQPRNASTQQCEKENAARVGFFFSTKSLKTLKLSHGLLLDEKSVNGRSGTTRTRSTVNFLGLFFVQADLNVICIAAGFNLRPTFIRF